MSLPSRLGLRSSGSEDRGWGGVLRSSDPKNEDGVFFESERGSSKLGGFFDVLHEITTGKHFLLIAALNHEFLLIAALTKELLLRAALSNDFLFMAALDTGFFL